MLRLLIVWLITVVTSMERSTYQIQIRPSYIGTQNYLTVHEYNCNLKDDAKSVYIQASLHADEIPGLLVCHHLIKYLDQAAKAGLIQENIKIVSYANPLGLSQRVSGSHIGRFSLESGINFNRDWPDVTNSVIKKIQTKLIHGDTSHNIRTIRQAILHSVEEEYKANCAEKSLKKELYKMASIADIVLDLHCDTEAVIHMYTHDRLWPNLKDLAIELQAYCTLLAPHSGGTPCDEACSCLWATIGDTYPDLYIPMACEAVTVELRGETSVSHDLAQQDAQGIIRFLQRRGFIKSTVSTLVPHTNLSTSTLSLLHDATPLSAVDMIESPIHGVVVWNATIGSFIHKNQIIGEVIDIENTDITTNQYPIISQTDGILFCTSLKHLVFPGQVIAKVAGKIPLEWRTGQLLTV